MVFNLYNIASSPGRQWGLYIWDRPYKISTSAYPWKHPLPITRESPLLANSLTMLHGIPEESSVSWGYVLRPEEGQTTPGYLALILFKVMKNFDYSRIFLRFMEYSTKQPMTFINHTEMILWTHSLRGSLQTLLEGWSGHTGGTCIRYV